MKKRFIFAALAVAAFTAPGCLNASPKTVFGKITGIDLPDYECVAETDTRGGFHGDGELIYIFRFNQENGRIAEEKICGSAEWSPLPMDGVLYGLVYEHFEGNVPHVLNGYYFFYDFKHKTYDAGEVENDYSYDFAVGLFDSSENIAYYYEQHT